MINNKFLNNVKIFFSKIKVQIKPAVEKLEADGKYFVVFGVLLVFLMGLVCVAVFFTAVKGSEEVLVPNVKGKELPDALVEMQQKELYPKIQLRYSESPDERGLVLGQSPAGGTIVKAGRRITLTVSRGVILNQVENYIGQNFDEVKIHLQAVFASMSKPLIVLADPPLYKFDKSAPGTVLEQDPPAGTDLSDPVTLKLVVSRGPEAALVKVPKIVGMNINDLLTQMARSRLIFDFSSRPAETGETVGAVVSQLPEADQLVNNYSRVAVVLAYPRSQPKDRVYGIYSFTLPQYLYPVQVELVAQTPDGNSFTVVNMQHPGGLLTIPYELPAKTSLTLFVLGTETDSVKVQ